MKLLDDVRSALLQFAVTDWKFSSHNYDEITSLQSDEDRRLFPVDTQDKPPEDLIVELHDNYEKIMMSLKKYVLKENMDNLDKARRRIYM